MMDIDKFVSLDLEMNQPSGRIIQIGFCIGDIQTGKINEKYRLYVDPKEPISEYIENLTGINDNIIKQKGMSLQEAYDEVVRIMNIHKPFMNPITWGGGDSIELRDQLGITPDQYFIFGRRWIDAKTLFISWRLSRNEQFQGGLAKSMIKMGLKFEGRKHDATDDAVNTFKIYCELLKKMSK